MLQQLKAMGFDWTFTGNNNFMQFSAVDVQRDNSWKFHLSIDPNDTGRASEIIIEELSKNGHKGLFKIATSETNRDFGNPAHEQAGKNITIYSDNDHARMARIMEAIERRFEQEGIRPGPRVNGDRAVPGSAYASYRNDSVNGSYSADKTHYNVGGHDDPYRRMLFVMETTKGPMIRTDRMAPHEVEAFKQVLEQRGISYEQRPSGANNGREVINISPASRAQFEVLRAEMERPVATQAPGADSITSAREALAKLPTIETDKGLYIDINNLTDEQKTQIKSTLKAQGLDFNEKFSSLNGGITVLALNGEDANRFRAIQAEAADRAAGRHGGASAKVDRGLGRAGAAVEAADRLSQGDVVGAAAAVAQDSALNRFLGFLGKRIPGVGAIITAGSTLYSSGSEAAQGNYGKALSELGAGAAETVGNVVGFGAGDGLREAFRAAVAAVADEKYVPEKSGLRQVAETAVDMGKRMAGDDQQKPDLKEIEQRIQDDPTLPDTVKLNGQEVSLAEALRNDSFRKHLLTNLENAQAKGHDLQAQINMIKEYEEAQKAAKSENKPDDPSKAQEAQAEKEQRQQAAAAAPAP